MGLILQKVCNELELFDDGDGEHMSLDEFIEACENNSFVDYDGYGALSTATHTARLYVNPSELRTLRARVSEILTETGIKFTHVMWYNK